MTITARDKEFLTQLKQDSDNCPICHGRDSTMSCKCYKRRIHEAAKITANIPYTYRSFTWDTIDEPALKGAIKKIREYADNILYNKTLGKGLYIHGGPGTAKTSVGCIVLIEALKKGCTAYYVDTTEYVDNQFDSMRGEAEDALEGKLKDEIEFLVIDNMGYEHRDAKGLIKSWLEELIRYRADQGRPTIILTHQPVKELMSSNAKLDSLMNEKFFPPIELKCKDHRKVTRNKDEASKE